MKRDSGLFSRNISRIGDNSLENCENSKISNILEEIGIVQRTLKVPFVKCFTKKSKEPGTISWKIAKVQFQTSVFDARSTFSAFCRTGDNSLENCESSTF